MMMVDKSNWRRDKVGSGRVLNFALKVKYVNIRDHEDGYDEWSKKCGRWVH